MSSDTTNPANVSYEDIRVPIRDAWKHVLPIAPVFLGGVYALRVGLPPMDHSWQNIAHLVGLVLVIFSSWWVGMVTRDVQSQQSDNARVQRGR